MLTKQFAQVLIEDYKGFIEEIKDKDLWEALGFLAEKNAHRGLCLYSEHTYGKDVFSQIGPLIPGLYITNTPNACLCVYSAVETLQIRVDWLVNHMDYFENEVV